MGLRFILNLFRDDVPLEIVEESIKVFKQKDLWDFIDYGKIE